MGLVAGYAAPPEPQRPAPPERHLDVEHPGQLVQLDCFCIGRLSGTKGTVWQYTAIDVASAYAWATLQVTRRNPSAVWTSQLARTVAAELAKHGWKLERVMSDNASEFRCPLPDPQADRPPPRSSATFTTTTPSGHTGRWTKGRTPQAVLGKAKLWQKKR
jgi:Integrase core domain